MNVLDIASEKYRGEGFAVCNAWRGSQVKKQLCLFGILCLIGVECQFNTAVFAKGMEENRNPQITIEEFVRSVHPHGVSISSAKQYSSSSSASNQDNVRTLLGMLKKEDEKPFWSTIVVTLGIIADPSAVPEVISFNENLERKSDLEAVESRALFSGVWALGIVINLRGDTESAHGELGEASKFLIKKSRGNTATTSNQQHGFPSPAHQLENVSSNETLVREAAILGMAFANTKETKEELAKIREEETDQKFRIWLDQVIQAQEEIHKVGLLCYREPQSRGC